MNTVNPTLAHGLAGMFFQLGMLIVLLSGLLWFVTGFIGGREMAKRVFMWGAIVTVLGMSGAAGINAVANAFGAMPSWLSFMIVTITLGFIFLGLFGLFARLFMPAEAANSMVGDLAASLVRAVLVPFRGSFRALRRLFMGSWYGGP